MTTRVGAILMAAAVLVAADGAAEPLRPQGPLRLPSGPLPGCDGATGYDDGVPETGYGWVPTVRDGIYVQSFPASAAAGGVISEVCVCWLRTRTDSTVDFSVLIYADVGGAPAAHPSVVVPAAAADVPQGISGRFYPVDVGQVRVPSDPYYVGVEWDAATDGYFFVCADSSPTSPRVAGFFRDERSHGWASVLKTSDPIFAAHRAMMLRIRSAVVTEVPALDRRGMAGFALVLAGLGWVAARRLG